MLLDKQTLLQIAEDGAKKLRLKRNKIEVLALSEEPWLVRGTDIVRVQKADKDHVERRMEFCQWLYDEGLPFMEPLQSVEVHNYIISFWSGKVPSWQGEEASLLEAFHELSNSYQGPLYKWSVPTLEELPYQYQLLAAPIFEDMEAIDWPLGWGPILNQDLFSADPLRIVFGPREYDLFVLSKYDEEEALNYPFDLKGWYYYPHLRDLNSLLLALKHLQENE